MGRDAGKQRPGIFPLHSRDEPALRPAGGAENVPGGRVGERLPPARSAGGGDATRGTRLGLELWACNPAEYSSSITAVLLPDGCSESAFRAVVLERFNMSLGSGLGKAAGKVFRIGHLGDFNELMLAGALAGIEMGLELAGIPHRKGGINAALDYLTGQAKAAA